MPARTSSGSAGYHGRPVLQEPTWTWEIPVYFFVGGLAGASAVVAAASRLAPDTDTLARDARWIAAAGAAASAPLLISDLGRPERFLNMLRVFKPQSPMSVGAWTLVAFSTAASAAAFADLVGRRWGGGVPVRVVRDAADILAAGTGLVMTTYTGVLVGTTTIPVWNRNIRLLPHHFAASSLGAAVGALELLGHRHRALHGLGLAAAAVETVLGLSTELSRERADRPLQRGRSGWLVRAGVALAGPVALGLRLTGRRRAAATAALAGSLLSRWGWIEAGRTSARDPSVVLALDEPRDGSKPERRG